MKHGGLDARESIRAVSLRLACECPELACRPKLNWELSTAMKVGMAGEIRQGYSSTPSFGMWRTTCKKPRAAFLVERP